MAYVGLEGLTESLIITQLDGISIKSVLADRRKVNYEGDFLGKVDGERFTRKQLAFIGGYLLHARYTPLEEMQRPLYVSTLGTVLSYSQMLPHAYFGLDYGDIDFIVDNMVVLHDSRLSPVSSLRCAGEIRGKKDTTDVNGHMITEGTRMNGNECEFNFNGSVNSEPALGGEIIELDGSFKLKILTGWAERYGIRYKLRGDWEAVFRGHVTTEVGSVSILKEYPRNFRVTSSLIKVSVPNGELI